MRQLFLAALGVIAVAGVASAQQPQQYRPLAATPILPASGTTYISGGAGCNGCGTSARGYTMAGGGCQTGQACNNGCGSIKSDLGFHFGSCKSFFSPCGPGLHGHGGCGHGGLFGLKNCPTLPFAQPWGQGWTCPPIYDSYANH